MPWCCDTASAQLSLAALSLAWSQGPAPQPKQCTWGNPMLTVMKLQGLIIPKKDLYNMTFASCQLPNGQTLINGTPLIWSIALEESGVLPSVPDLSKGTKYDQSVAETIIYPKNEKGVRNTTFVLLRQNLELHHFIQKNVRSCLVRKQHPSPKLPMSL